MKVVPHIEGSEIVKLEVDGVVLSLTQNIPLSELSKVLEYLSFLGEYIDFTEVLEEEEELEEWTEDEISDFLNERNSRQITFFEILSEKGEIERDDLLEEMKRRLKVQEFRGLQLAGSLAGIGIRTNRLGKEYLYVKEWRGDYRYYRLAEKYAAIIKEWLES